MQMAAAEPTQLPPSDIDAPTEARREEHAADDALPEDIINGVYDEEEVDDAETDDESLEPNAAQPDVVYDEETWWQ